jgi:hypothetical protein
VYSAGALASLPFLVELYRQHRPETRQTEQLQPIHKNRLRYIVQD